MTEANAYQQEPLEPAGADSLTLEQAMAKIAELETKLAETKDQALRALAEADNTRKRAERERQDTAKFSVSSFARDLLPVADNLRRALSAITPAQREANAEMKNIYVGVEATERELIRMLEMNGVKKIDAMGQPFNPNLHEVMFEADDPTKTPGTIVQVIESGYMIHDRLLRPAKVGVAKGGEASPHIDQQI